MSLPNSPASLAAILESLSGTTYDAEDLKSSKVYAAAIAAWLANNNLTADITDLKIGVTQLNSDLQGLTGSENRFVKALGTRLCMGLEDACITVLGDSTGNGDNEWVYTSSQWLASKFPKYTFAYKLWNDTTQSYGNLVILQSGTGGDGTACAMLNGTGGNYISTPDKDSLRITGDIDVAIKFNATTWGTAGVALVSKFGDAGQRAWALEIGATGIPYLWISNDGTANFVISATQSLTLNTDIWLRATLDVNNGSGGNTVNFYTSTDGVNWTQLGTTIITTGTTSIFASTTPLVLGVRTFGGSSDLFTGKIYEAIVKNGINGTVVANPKAIGSAIADSYNNTWTLSGSVYVISSAPTVTILNGSTSGKTIAYSLNNTRFNLQVSQDPQLIFISYSHNEGTNTAYQATYESLCTKILTKYPNAGIVCVTQNPQTPPELNINAHAIRNRQISMLSAKNDYALVDVFRVFMETGDYASYVADGCHPTQAGFDLWRDEVIKFLTPVI